LKFLKRLLFNEVRRDAPEPNFVADALTHPLIFLGHEGIGFLGHEGIGRA
jgi:hypothetical protein